MLAGILFRKTPYFGVYDHFPDWHSTMEKMTGLEPLQAIDYKGLIQPEYIEKH